RHALRDERLDDVVTVGDLPRHRDVDAALGLCHVCSPQLARNSSMSGICGRVSDVTSADRTRNVRSMPSRVGAVATTTASTRNPATVFRYTSTRCPRRIPASWV